MCDRTLDPSSLRIAASDQAVATGLGTNGVRHSDRESEFLRPGTILASALVLFLRSSELRTNEVNRDNKSQTISARVTINRMAFR